MTAPFLPVPRAVTDASAALPTPIRTDDLGDILHEANGYAAKGAPADLLDKFVSTATDGAFTSHAELKQRAALDAPAAAFNLLSGLPFGDRLMAGVASLTGHGPYKENLAAVRKEQGVMRDVHPLASILENIEGGGMLSMVPGMNPTLTGGRAMVQAAKGAGSAGLAGALYGAGSTPDFSIASPGEIAGRTATGAAVAAPFGALAGLGAHWLGGKGTGSASDRLKQMIEESADPETGRSGEEVLRDAAGKMQAAGRPFVPADLTSSTAGAAQFAAQNHSAVMDRYFPIMAKRVGGTAERLVNDVGDILGAEPNSFDRADELEAVRQKVSQGYADLRANAPNLKGNQALESTIQSLQENHLLTDASVARTAEKALESGDYSAYNSVRQWVRDRAHDIMTGQESAPKGIQGVPLKEAGRAMDDALSQSVPGYTEQNQAYAAVKGQQNALDLAKKFAQGTDYRALERQFSTLGPEEQQQLRYGLASQLVKELNDVRSGQGTAQRYLVGSGNLDQKLKLVFGSDQNLEQWKNALQSENNYARTLKAFGGSQTHAREVEGEAQHPLTEVLRGYVGPEGVSPRALIRMPIGESKNAAAQRAAGHMGPVLFQPANSVDELMQRIEALRGWHQRLASLGGRLAPGTVGAGTGAISQGQEP